MNATQMKTYRISDNTDTVEVKAASLREAVMSYDCEQVVALSIDVIEYSEDCDEWVATEEYIRVIRRPGIADTDDEIGDDPSFEIISGGGPIATEWLPLWQRQ